MIEIREVEYLAEIDGALVIVKVTEHFLFGKWRYKLKETHSYNNALIQAFKVPEEYKKQKPIGFVTNNKSKKKKRNENKSKDTKPQL